MESYLSVRIKEYPHVLSIFMGKPDGTMIDSTFWVPEKDYIPPERDWYKKALESDKCIFTNPYIDSATGSLIISISKTITLDDKPVGVMEKVWNKLFQTFHFATFFKGGNIILYLKTRPTLICYTEYFRIYYDNINIMTYYVEKTRNKLQRRISMKEELTLLESTQKINKIFVIIVITSIIFGVLTLLTSFKTNSLNNQKSLLQKESTNLKEASDFLTEQIRLYVLTGDKKYSENYLKEANETKTTTKSIENIKSIGIKKNELDLINTSKQESDDLVKVENEAIKYAQSGNLKKAQELVLGSSYDSKKSIINDNVNAFQSEIMNRVTKTLSIFQALLFLFNITTIILMILILYSFSKYSNFVKSNVIKPIISLKNCFSEISLGNLNSEITLKEDSTEIGEFTTVAKKTQTMLKEYIDDIYSSLNKISKGDITKSIELEYIGDFEQIKTSINCIIDSLNETLSEINSTAKQVALGSDEIANSSSLLSEGATNQAASIEELSATINEMYAKIKLNSDNAINVNTIIKETSEKMFNSNEKMKNMLLAMEKITTSSNEISSIIGAINSMAFQTNLLAINTSIEASKANGNGKQFAVIAEEIRKLADSSSQAASKTSQLIAESLLAVDNGNTLSNEISEMIDTIVQDSIKISTLVTEISDSSKDQAASAMEVTKATEKISNVIETNSSAAEEFSAASEELAAQASLLSESVMKFKLK